MKNSLNRFELCNCLAKTTTQYGYRDNRHETEGVGGHRFLQTLSTLKRFKKN